MHTARVVTLVATTVLLILQSVIGGQEAVPPDCFGVVEVYARVPGFPLPKQLQQYPQMYDWPELILVRTRQPARLGAVALGPDLLVTRDCMIEPDAVQRVLVRNSKGQTANAVLVGRHPTVPCLVFKADRPLFRPIRSGQNRPAIGEVTSVRLLHVDDYWHLHKETALREPIWHRPEQFVIGTGLSDSQLNLGQVLYSNREAFIDSPAVLVAESTPFAVGFSSGVHFEADAMLDGLPLSPPSEAALVTPEKQRAAVARIEAAAAKSTVSVRLRFRKAEGAEETVADLDALGLVLGSGYILVPRAVTRAQAALIETVTLEPDSDEPVPATFVGALREYEAFLVQADTKALEKLGVAPPQRSRAHVGTYRLYGATHLNWAYGTRFFQTRLARPYSIDTSFYGGTVFYFTPTIPRGTAVWTLDAELVGVELRERDPYAGLDEMLPSPPPTLAVFSSRHSPSSVFITADHLDRWLQQLDRVLDPRVRPVPPGQEHRRPWLGVEFARVSKDLADALGCRKETRDGTIGLQVQLVYPGSPAEKAGIRVGDILLALSFPDYPRLIELTGRRRPTGNVREVLERLMRQRMFGNRRRAAGPWPSRDNYLTELLAILGPGTKVSVIYWRDGKLYNVPTTIELAPPDQDSAAKYENKKLGLTVKELTYEVRAALQLGPDAPGVVVAKVDSGTAASQARLRPGEIIVTADDQPLHSPEDLKAAVQQAQKAGKASIRLRVVERGRSRFADLRLD